MRLRVRDFSFFRPLRRRFAAVPQVSLAVFLSRSLSGDSWFGPDVLPPKPSHSADSPARCFDQHQRELDPHPLRPYTHRRRRGGMAVAPVRRSTRTTTPFGRGPSSYRWNIPLTTSAPLTRAAESRRRHGGRAQGPKHEEGEGESRSSRRRSPEGCRRQDVRVSGSTAPYSWPSFGQTRSSTPAESCRWPLAARAPSSSLCLPFPGMRAPSCR